MAKKHSSKTATEKAMSASEPRLQTFTGWQGISFTQAPLGWEPLETGPHDQRQNDLRPNFLHVQNNLVTVENQTIETRPDSEIIGEAPDGMKFTGVACIYHRWLFCVVRESFPEIGTKGSFKDRVAYRDITTKPANNWTIIQLHDAEVGGEPYGYEISEIGYFEQKLIATTWHRKDQNPGDPPKYEGEIFTAKLVYTKQYDTDAHGIHVSSDSIQVVDENNALLSRLTSVPYVPDPIDVTRVNSDYGYGAVGPRVTKGGTNTKFEITNDSSKAEARLTFSCVWVNRFGSTIASKDTSVMVTMGPQSFSSQAYLKISGHIPASMADKEIKGVDVYVTVNDYQTKSFAAHVDVTPSSSGSTPWTVNWLGGLQDVSQWTNVQLEEPKENTTKGVHAAHFTNHDSRLYFWGDPEHPYRLYIGGVPGNELSIARGHGGAFIDIEPGTGLEVMGTAKWKTSSGANIVTIMCGNPNTNMIKRFNLVETNLTVTNEVSSKGYMYEEVSNVVGCNSRWGYGVFGDGLYALNRYGLLLTTMAMEYNNQMRTQNIAEMIKPIFTERLGHRLDDSRLVCIDDVVYIVLSEENSPDEPTVLDQVILCYDLDTKAWYTFTHDEYVPEGAEDDYAQTGELILHAMAIDSQEYTEGLGIITDQRITLYPTTGIQGKTPPKFNVLMETGELMGKQPKQMTMYLCQLELRFDYFIGNAKVIVEGIDYYGRPVTVVKELNSRINPGTNYNGDIINPDDDGVTRNKNLMRDYTEWIRVDKLMESYRIRIIGKARFRLNNINAKVYAQDDKIGLPYGFDSHIYYQNRHGSTNDDNHWIRDYNNLRRTLLT